MENQQESFHLLESKVSPMLHTKRVYSYIFLIWTAIFFIHVLPFVGCSVLQEPDQDTVLTRMNIKPKNHSSQMKKLSSQMTFDMTLHGLLLWASMGFLMPLGILILRMSNTNISTSRESSATKIKLFYYFHLILQILSVLLSTAGAIMSIQSFENSFSNNHQRLGLVLYCAIWVQAILGFSRPLKGSRKRGAWYFLHWLLGTTILVAGIINIYTGLQAYEKKTSKSVMVWTVLFTAEVSFMAAFYLLQDKWDYIKKQQGVVFGDVPVRPSSSTSDDQEMGTSNNVVNGNTDDDQQRVNDKRLWGAPCPKANALKNLF